MRTNKRKREDDELAEAVDELEDEEEASEGEDEEVLTKKEGTLWVCCDKCEKWRRQPVNIGPLPKKWYCHMSEDPLRNYCGAPEEDYMKSKSARNEARERRLRMYLRSWHSRLEFADKAERMLPFHQTGSGGASSSGTSASSSSGGGSKSKKRGSGSLSDSGFDWIRCCSIGCGKWRSLPKNLDTKAFVEGRAAWYCVMNTWDPSLASCNAPEETLCRLVPW